MINADFPLAIEGIITVGLSIISFGKLPASPDLSHR